MAIYRQLAALACLSSLSACATALTGNYSGVLGLPGGAVASPNQVRLSLVQSGKKVQGKFESGVGNFPAPISGMIQDNTIEVEVLLRDEQNGPATGGICKYVSEVTGTGTLLISGPTLTGALAIPAAPFKATPSASGVTCMPLTRPPYAIQLNLSKTR